MPETICSVFGVTIVNDGPIYTIENAMIMAVPLTLILVVLLARKFGIRDH